MYCHLIEICHYFRRKQLQSECYWKPGTWKVLLNGLIFFRSVQFVLVILILAQELHVTGLLPKAQLAHLRFCDRLTFFAVY